MDPRPPARDPDALFALLYEELRGLAEALLSRERPDHTLRPTALVHEAYLRLRDRRADAFANESHFRALAARAMRHVLVDHARAHRALKRGGGWRRITVSEAIAVSPDASEDVLALDDAIERLGREDAVAARIVEMRFFAGLTEVEIAAELGYSERWVRGQWAFARAWLRRALVEGDGSGAPQSQG